MKFFVYSTYDPATECFDSRVNLGPLDPKEMAEQYRRAHIKMSDADKAFMEGKKAICLGTWDDITGKFEQAQILEIYTFKPKEEKPGQINKEESDEAKA